MIVGFILLALSFAFPMTSSRIRADAKLRSTVWAILLAHQIAIAYHVTMGGLPTMRLDPLSFNAFAMTGQGRLVGEPYAQFLHLIYRHFGGSHFLGCQVSNMFFSLALMFQMKLLCRLRCERCLPTLMLIFGLPLSCIFNTSVTLREAAQMFLFLALVNLLADLYDSGLGSRTLLVIPVFFFLGKLHHGLTAALAIVLPLALAWALKSRPLVFVALVCMSFSGSFLFADKIVANLSAESTAFNSVASGDLGYIQNYATNVGEGRTDFGVDLDLRSIPGFLSTGPLVYFYYLFSPLPWQIKGPLDIYGVLESSLRIGLVWFSILGVLNTKGGQRDRLVLLLILFFGVEAAWAAGTANWGTAFRHRLVAWGILVATGGYGWMNSRSLISGLGERSSGRPSSVRSRRRALSSRKVRKTRLALEE